MFYHPWVPGLLYEMAAEFERTGVAKIPEGRREDVIQAVSLAAYAPVPRDAYNLLLDSLLLSVAAPAVAESLDLVQVVKGGLKSLPDDVLAALALNKVTVSRLHDLIFFHFTPMSTLVAPEWFEAFDNAPEIPDRVLPKMRPTSELVEEVLGPFINPAVIERLRKYEAEHPDEFRPAKKTSSNG